MKTLYIMVTDGGDGSYSLTYSLEPDAIAAYEKRYENDELESGDTGVDGDGFHYDTLTVPDDATYESLGISEYSRLIVKDAVDDTDED